jgi:hypothetical protein
MFKVTPAGTKKVRKPYIKYDSIKVNIEERRIELINNGTTVANYIVDLRASDTLTIVGLRGKLEVELL